MNKKKRGIVIFLFSVFLCFCIALTANFFITQHKRERYLYMRMFFEELNTASLLLSNLAEDSTLSMVKLDSLINLQWSLNRIGDTLEVGYSFVDKSIPIIADWWFDSSASTLSNYIYAPQLLPDNFDLTEYLQELHCTLNTLKESLSDKENLNLNPDLTLEEFSQIIYDFYVFHSS